VDGAVLAEKVEALTTRLERTIKGRFPEVRRLFIETQSAAGHLGAAAAEVAPAHTVKDKPKPEAATAPALSRKAKKRSKRAGR